MAPPEKELFPKDTHPDVEQRQIAMLREAGPARRFTLTRSLSRSVIEMSRAAVKRRHPDLSSRECALRWVALCYGENLARRVAAYLEERGVR
ncbi:hypothetical protein JW916_12560 [Candidatus Sumerlaeota bacterium]|nr:hypothetical protein [Candidatus Sumerlaeota bacterium]